MNKEALAEFLKEVDALKTEAVSELSMAEDTKDIFRLQGKIQAYDMVLHIHDQMELDKKVLKNA